MQVLPAPCWGVEQGEVQIGFWGQVQKKVFAPKKLVRTQVCPGVIKHRILTKNEFIHNESGITIEFTA